MFRTQTTLDLHEAELVFTVLTLRISYCIYDIDIQSHLYI
jgi:hypothetical protein